jgi:hypothetical protein
VHGAISTSERLAALGRRPVFSVDGAEYTWDDVLAWSAARGALEGLRRRVYLGLTLAARREPGSLVDESAVNAAATEFRYDRGLLAAEELTAWLERWSLTVREWGEHLERALLLEGADDPAVDGDEISTEIVVEAEYVDAVCSGFLEAEADGFAADVALAAGASEDAGPGRQATVEETIAAAAAARRGAKAKEGVEREVARRALDWTRLELDVLELDDEGAAREAALCVRLDGRSLADVAADCHAWVSRLTTYVADVEPWAQPLLLAAQPGDLVGPLEQSGRFVLFEVHRRTPPSPADPAIRDRAETTLVERAVKRATDGWVEWHDVV